MTVILVTVGTITRISVAIQATTEEMIRRPFVIKMPLAKECLMVKYRSELINTK